MLTLNQTDPPLHTSPLPWIVAPVGLDPIVIVILSETVPQGPAGSFVVRVRVTVPAVLSPALGVYTALRSFAFGAYEPAPPDQVAFEAEPPIDPARGAVESAHID